ncbi:sulfide/dihydroorotate dehydrogenase-like FAD/NAD-binding protein [Lentimicrobium sp.]
MFTIIQRKKLNSKVTSLEVFSPRIAEAILPGQYVNVQARPESSVLTLPVCGWDTKKGSITLLVEQLDEHTSQLATNLEIFILHDLIGPLGQPSELTYCHDRELINSRLLFVADGIGAAIALSQMKWLADIGCRADVMISAPTKEEMLFTSELEKVCDNIYFITQDGSSGFHGNEAQLLEMLLNKEEKPYDLIITSGPLIMMKAVSTTAKNHGIPATVNLTPQLFESDPTQGAFKVNTSGHLRNIAIEGPEFQALTLDFDQTLKSLEIGISAQESDPAAKSKIVNLPGKSDTRFSRKQA